MTKDTHLKRFLDPQHAHYEIIGGDKEWEKTKLLDVVYLSVDSRVTV